MKNFISLLLLSFLLYGCKKSENKIEIMKAELLNKRVSAFIDTKMKNCEREAIKNAWIRVDSAMIKIAADYRIDSIKLLMLPEKPEKPDFKPTVLDDNLSPLIDSFPQK